MVVRSEHWTLPHAKGLRITMKIGHCSLCMKGHLKLRLQSFKKLTSIRSVLRSTRSRSGDSSLQVNSPCSQELRGNIFHIRGVRDISYHLLIRDISYNLLIRDISYHLLIIDISSYHLLIRNISYHLLIIDIAYHLLIRYIS